MTKTTVQMGKMEATINNDLVWESEDKEFADLLNETCEGITYGPADGFPDIFIAKHVAKASGGRVKIVSMDDHPEFDPDVVY